MPRQFLHCEIGKSYNLRVQTSFRMGLEFLDFIDGCKAFGGGFNTTPEILECTERERGIFGLQDRLR